MTAYNDVPEANALYLESEQVEAAITFIDNGGWVSSFVVSPAPPTEGTVAPQSAVNIYVKGANDPALLAGVRAALVTRAGQIATELAALGVTYTPPTRAA